MFERILLRLSIFILACLLSPIELNAAPLEPYITDADTTFTLTDLKNDIHSLDDFRGKVVLVNFWASWCPPCIYEMPELQRLKKRYTNQAFEILAINVGEKKYKVRKFADVTRLELPVLLDSASKTFDTWKVKTLPTSFLVDINGKTRYRVRGNPGWETDETLSIIEGMLPRIHDVTEERH
jgi:thiol-disulfide isomerase/thioredoxin